LHEQHIASGSADFGTLQHEEGQVNPTELSSNELARQTGFKAATQPFSIGPSSTVGSRVSRYTIGTKLNSGAIIKEVREENWTYIKKEKGRDWYECNHCLKLYRKDNRSTHSCK
jgi:hypothetical protein